MIGVHAKRNWQDHTGLRYLDGSALATLASAKIPSENVKPSLRCPKGSALAPLAGSRNSQDAKIDDH